VGLGKNSVGVALYDEETSMIMRHALRVLFAAAIALLASGAIAKEEPSSCSRVGTWFGEVVGIGKWLATDTQGPNATSGQLILEWYDLDPTLGSPAFADVTRSTVGRGIWQKVRHGIYEYTWVAYGLSDNPPMTPVYAVRVSGLVIDTDCENATITYKLEIFPDPFNMQETPIPPAYGEGTETRMRMPVIQ